MTLHVVAALGLFAFGTFGGVEWIRDLWRSRSDAAVDRHPVAMALRALEDVRALPSGEPVRARVGRAALAAVLLVGAACGSDAQPVASVSQSALQAHHHAQDVASPIVPERDPFPVREPPTTRASRNRTGGGATTARPNTRPGQGAAPPTATAFSPASITVSSTAYCETGTMANGQRTYDGAVAMGTKDNPEPPFGTRYRVLSGPYAGRTLTVADRIGHGSSFDIAMPGRCQAAIDYGRKQITVERVG